MICLLLLVLHLESIIWLAAGANFSLPNCIDQCGDVQIPYPFGVGANCYHDKWFEIVCNDSVRHPKPFLRQFNLEVLEINWPGRYSRVDPRWNALEEDDHRLVVNLLPGNFCRSDGGKNPVVDSMDFHQSPYRFSRWFNVFIVDGCGVSVVLMNRSRDILTGCASVCANDGASMNATNCYGVGCCQASLLSSPTSDFIKKEEGIDFYQIAVDYVSTCDISAALIASDWVNNLSGKLSNLKAFPAVLEWNPNYIPLDEVRLQLDHFSCYYDSNAVHCRCEFPYEGNPYLPYGCQVVKECRKCRRRCAVGYSNHSRGNSYFYCEKNELLKRASILGGIIGLLLCCVSLRCVCLCLRKRKLKKMRERLFQKNGGILLMQQLPSFQNGNEPTRIFTSNKLKVATKNYSKQNILGKGGYGTVYKGHLGDQVVAIKRSEMSGEFQVEQFINEVVVLTQVSHRHVVKLLGCCLETETPLLVYEFVPNGNLYDHIHNNISSPWLSWESCLRIATEAADAFAYLHSAASIPIIHRDIKSSNILLDEKFMTKVSDFGSSRLVPMGQTQVTTLVQGTLGYLDPEYFQTSHLSEKSDVYSFGVVLAELLTRRKPIIWEKGLEERNLATHFLCAVKNNQLFSILEPQLMREATPEQLTTFAILVKQCLSLKGEERPSMKEVARKLEGLRKKNEEHVSVMLGEEKNHASAVEVKGYDTVHVECGNSSRMYTMEEEMITEMSYPR